MKPFCPKCGKKEFIKVANKRFNYWECNNCNIFFLYKSKLNLSESNYSSYIPATYQTGLGPAKIDLGPSKIRVDINENIVSILAEDDSLVSMLSEVKSREKIAKFINSEKSSISKGLLNLKSGKLNKLKK